jgi:hypothetical protein
MAAAAEAALLKLGPQKRKTTWAEVMTGPPWFTRLPAEAALPARVSRQNDRTDASLKTRLFLTGILLR